MWNIEDNTYNDIRKRSYENWLDELQEHQDIAVRGGVKLAREYTEYLENEIIRLKQENALKNEYLKKLKKK